MFLWCTDETEHNVFQGVGTSTGHVSSWGGCLWCETGRHLPTVIASSKCPQPATELAAPQHKLPNCDLAISASSWQFFSYWFLQRGLISSFGAFLSSRQCSFIVDGARILWHGHRLFNGQEGVTHSHNSESIVLTRKKSKNFLTSYMTDILVIVTNAVLAHTFRMMIWDNWALYSWQWHGHWTSEETDMVLLWVSDLICKQGSLQPIWSIFPLATKHLKNISTQERDPVTDSDPSGGRIWICGF